MYYSLSLVAVYFFQCFPSLFVSGNQDDEPWNTKDYLKREHSLTRPYQGTGMGLPNWDFHGSTMITSKFIRLTPDKQSRVGGIWNTVPVHVRNWEVQVHFRVHGAGKELFGDGLAFWYTKDRMVSGPVFGNKNYFLGLAVILDTYSNHNGPHNHDHPYISAMVNNGSLHYDHDRDGTHTQLAGCTSKFRNLEEDTYFAVRYEKDEVTVFTDIEGKKAWKECFKVSDIILPTGYYLGVTAATGDLSDNHEVVSMKFYQLDVDAQASFLDDRTQVIPSAKFYEAPREHVPDPEPSSMGIFRKIFFIIFGILGVLALLGFGFYVYTKQQDTSRKRFY